MMLPKVALDRLFRPKRGGASFTKPVNLMVTDIMLEPFSLTLIKYFGCRAVISCAGIWSKVVVDVSPTAALASFSYAMSVLIAYFHSRGCGKITIRKQIGHSKGSVPSSFGGEGSFTASSKLVVERKEVVSEAAYEYPSVLLAGASLYAVASVTGPTVERVFFLETSSSFSSFWTLKKCSFVVVVKV